MDDPFSFEAWENESIDWLPTEQELKNIRKIEAIIAAIGKIDKEMSTVLEANKKPPTLEEVPMWIEQFQEHPFALHRILDVHSTSISLEVLKQFVQAWPEALKRKKDDFVTTRDLNIVRGLPLHIVIINHAPLEIVQFLTEKWPAALSIRIGKSGDWDVTPLYYLLLGRGYTGNHYAIPQPAVPEMSNQEKLNQCATFEYLCQKFPIEACTKWIVHSVNTVDEGVNLFHDYCLKDKRVSDGTKCDKGVDLFHDYCLNLEHKPLDVIDTLIQNRPELLTSLEHYSTKGPGWSGRSILHRALECSTQLHSRIQKMLAKWPVLAGLPAACGELFPIHVCCQTPHFYRYGNYFADQKLILELLVQAYPNSIYKKVNGLLPLDLMKASLSRHSWSNERDWRLNNPALPRSAYPGMGDALVLLPEFLPFLVDDPDQPLMFYLSAGGGGNAEKSLDTFQYLLDNYQGVLDATGDLLLHLAARAGFATPEIFQLILELHPAACAIPGSDGDLPLHSAIKSGVAAPEVLQKILGACPDACSITDADGNLALHLALQSERAPIQFVEDLVAALPGSLGIKDSEGWMPFLLAAKSSADESLTQTFLLLQSAPENL